MGQKKAKKTIDNKLFYKYILSQTYKICYTSINIIFYNFNEIKHIKINRCISRPSIGI